MLRASFFLVTGLRNFTRGGYERAARSFSPTDTGDHLKGKYAMVTGANQGIGYQVSLELARRGLTCYMVCRNEARGQEAVERVRNATGNGNVHLLKCDVSSLEDIKSLADEYIASGRPLHVLVNNAGVMVHEDKNSVDGLELNFATNTLGSYALTRALEPALRRSAPSRVIFVSSGGALTEKLEVDDLEGAKIRGSDKGTVQYARDKRRQIAVAERLARDWGAQGAGIRCFSMHPGWTETEGVKTSIPGFYSAFKDRLRTLPQGADTIVWLACLKDATQLEDGGFYLDRQPQAKHLPLAGTKYAEHDVDRLMQKLDGLTAARGAPPK